MPTTHEPALALRFSATIGALTLHHVTACQGLDAHYEVYEFKEGGNAEHAHKLPAGVTYANVRITRPVDEDSAKLASWFSRVRRTLERTTASVVVHDGNGEVVARWNLEGVWPVRYTGPRLASATSAAAEETIELAHNGFVMSAS